MKTHLEGNDSSQGRRHLSVCIVWRWTQARTSRRDWAVNGILNRGGKKEVRGQRECVFGSVGLLRARPLACEPV